MTSIEREAIFIPVYDFIPENWEDARRVLVEHLRQISEAVNISEKGYYVDTETFAGKFWTPRARASINDPIEYRNVIRKVVDLGGLNDFSSGTPPNTQSVAHGIDFTEESFITALYGAATDPAASDLNAAIPLPFLDVGTLANGIQLDIDGTNINLTSSADYSAYTSAWVVIEYVEET